MDTRFSSAIHILIMIAGSEQSLTSEAIANSVGTNPSYIRKVTGLLKKKGILDSRQGIHGFSLLIPPEALSLYTIYQAINESDVHRTASSNGSRDGDGQGGLDGIRVLGDVYPGWLYYIVQVDGCRYL